MGMKFAEVNGKSQNRCVHGMVKLYKEKTGQGRTCPAKEKDMEVFGSSRGAKPRTPRSKAEYDFADVDLRETNY